MLLGDEYFDQYAELIIDKKRDINIRSLLSKLNNIAQDIENEFCDTIVTPPVWREITPPTTHWTTEEKALLVRVQGIFSEDLNTINNGLEYKEKALNIERKKINDIKPSDLKKQEDKIIDHISKLSNLLITSKSKVSTEK
jgi:hypothetical protein